MKEITNLLNFITAWKDAQRFLEDQTAWDALVIYSEGAQYSPYITPMINELVKISHEKIFYLSSDLLDPLYVKPLENLNAYFIGSGCVRTFVFKKMRAGVLAMTMPDLETFHIKRSAYVHHYNYFHHSLVSTHMVYRTGAFDNFDSIMSVGPYHEDEIREWERQKRLPKKQVFKHGSPPLDMLMQAGKKNRSDMLKSKKGITNVLLAPSWGPNGLLEAQGCEIISILLNAGYFVRLRPHPRTRHLSPKVINNIRQMFEDNRNFEIDEDISNHDALLSSDIMISDWSGVAMEFAFGLGRPVVFIDVARKVNNPEYTKISMIPIEVWYREHVGMVLSSEQLESLPQTLNGLVEDRERVEKKINALRKQLFYNLGCSARRGAEILMRTLHEVKTSVTNSC